jgi:hypothetical protein
MCDSLLHETLHAYVIVLVDRMNLSRLADALGNALYIIVGHGILGA